MNTCKTCQHWTLNKNSARYFRLKESDRLHFCNAPDIQYGYHIRDSDIPSNGVLIEDDEGWGMLTGPDFGCVLYEEKTVKA